LGRHSILEINKNALLYNLNLVREKILPSQKILAIVKADAYGLGAQEIARLYQKNGIDFFAVACIQEAEELRNAGISTPILVLSPFFEEEIDEYFHFDIIPTLTDFSRAKTLSEKARKMNKDVKAHFKIDTGMGRLGFRWNEAKDEILKISGLKNIHLEGLFSHFPSADIEDDFSLEQISRFKETAEILSEKGIFFHYKHIANTSGILRYNDPYFNLVRPGIVLYGAYPSSQMSAYIKPQTAAVWKSRIIQTKKLKQGDSVSYGRIHTLNQPKEIGIVPVGYADGFSTLNSEKGFVYAEKHLCPVLGRVCMDYFMIDITGKKIHTGSEVMIYGDEPEIRVEKTAERTGLISYEILTGISKKTDRFYF